MELAPAKKHRAWASRDNRLRPADSRTGEAGDVKVDHAPGAGGDLVEVEVGEADGGEGGEGEESQKGGGESWLHRCAPKEARFTITYARGGGVVTG